MFPNITEMKAAIMGRPSMSMGGGELVTITLARELEDRGHDVTVLTPPFDIPGDPDSDGPEELKKARQSEPFTIETTDSPIYNVPGVPLLWKKMVLHPWLAFAGSSNDEFDIWFATYGLYPVTEYWTRRGFSIAHYFHSPIVADKCGPLQRYTVYPPVSALYTLTTLSGGTNFPAASNSELTQRRVRGEHNIDSTVIYPPVDTKSFATPVGTTERLPEGRYALLSGRFVPFKKFEIALNRLEAAVEDGLLDTVIVAGRLDSQDYYNYLQKTYSFAEFRTNVPGDQWLSLHQMADVYVFSNYEEDFGLTGAEAAAAGTPVVAPRGPGVSELLAEWEHGYIVDDDMSGTHDAVASIVSESSDVRPSPQICDQCNIETFVDKMLALQIDYLGAQDEP